MEKGNFLSHILLWVGFGLVGVWLIYSATHSNTENNKYAPGSASYSIENHYSPLSSLIPCGAFFKIDHEPGARSTANSKAGGVNK